MNSAPKTLVVEDSPPNRMILCHLLQKMGFEVYDTADGKEALQWLKHNTPDLIMSDLMMPNMGGVELLKHVRANSNFDAVIFFIVTALGEESFLKQVSTLNCSGFLLKPISVQALKDLLHPHFPHLPALKSDEAA
jgi:twitching motility two-component system response regulator PilH